MTIKFLIGNNSIRSYRRMAYTPWHAIAEFVDNSSQSYLNNKAALDERYEIDGDQFLVSIAYGPENGGELSIADNAMGMNLIELERALEVGLPPTNATGRSRYGMGMKTAACWIGNIWSVETKKLGEPLAYRVTVDVESVADGASDLPIESFNRDPNQHYTLIKIQAQNRKFAGRTLGKIKEYLSSMYREDFRAGIMILQWQGQVLNWDEIDGRLMRDRAGELYKMPFDFDVDGKRVWGWAGVLEDGGRAYAGFSMIHSGRVVKGYPDSWRPDKIFGGGGGRNDLINQRLVGEIHLDDFDVSHTKDDILWFDDEEDRVEEALRAKIKGYIERARTPKKKLAGGPSEGEIDAAISTLRQELTSKEMVDQIEITLVPPPEDLKSAQKAIADEVTKGQADFIAKIGEKLTVSVFIEESMSANDPYVIYDSAKSDALCVIINQNHPHFHMIEGTDGVANYFRHCIYDAIAEWQAGNKVGSLDASTIKTLKDGLLRVALKLEQSSGSPESMDL